MRQGLDDALSLLIPPPHPKRSDDPLGEGYEPGLGVAAYLAEIGGPKDSAGPSSRRSHHTSPPMATRPMPSRLSGASATPSPRPIRAGDLPVSWSGMQATITSTRSSTGCARNTATSRLKVTNNSRHHTSSIPTVRAMVPPQSNTDFNYILNGAY